QVPQAKAVHFNDIWVPGAVYAEADGVNVQLDIVGYFAESSGEIQAFLQKGSGEFTAFVYPVGAVRNTYAQGINDAGAIVGFFQNEDFTIHTFIKQNGQFTQLDFPGGSNTMGHGINNNGDIVGIYRDSSLKQHGFVYSGGTWTTLDIPGAGVTEP